MRICLVTQWFPPEPGAAVAAAIADGLAERGHHVDVLTGFPNYPTGKLYDGYRLERYRREVRSRHVIVHRAPLYPSHDSSALGRMANYLSFAAAAALVGRRHITQPDAWLVYSSPATAAIPALLGSWRSDRPVHLLIEDLWPDSVTQSGLLHGGSNQIVDRALRTFCNWTYRRASGIGIISPSMKDILVARGVEETKVAYTPNWVDGGSPPEPASSGLRVKLGLPTGRLFMYAGNMGELQGLEPLVCAFAQVPNAHLCLIGGGIARSRIEDLVRGNQIGNVSLLEAQPAERISTYIATSDIQVVSLRDTPLLRATMPSKVQNSLAAGKPILVHAAGDVADIVNENKLGYSCKSGQLEATIHAIRYLASVSSDQLAAMGQRSRALYEKRFSPTAGVDRLERLLLGEPAQLQFGTGRTRK